MLFSEQGNIAPSLHPKMCTLELQNENNVSNSNVSLSQKNFEHRDHAQILLLFAGFSVAIRCTHTLCRKS